MSDDESAFCSLTSDKLSLKCLLMDFLLLIECLLIFYVGWLSISDEREKSISI